MAKVCKVPALLQMEALECGAASLCMVLAYHGKWLPLERVRADCGVSRDGSNAKNILMAARRYGLHAQPFRCEPEGLRDLALPAIIHWNFNHFVVLDGFKKDRAVLNDPARGRVEVSLEQFDNSFTGIALCFTPTDDFTREGKPPSVLGFAMKRMKAMTAAVVFVMLTTLVTTMLGVITPLFSRVFMDNILSGKNPEWLIQFTLLFGAAAILQLIISAVESLSLLHLNGRFAVSANSEYIWHVLRLPMEFFSARWAGDILARQSANERISSEIMETLAPLAVNTAFLTLYLVMMLRYSPQLTAIGIAASVLNILVARYTAKKSEDIQRKAQKSGCKLSGATVAAVDMIESIKAAGAENGFFGRWAGYFAVSHNAQVQILRFTNVYSIFPVLISQLANIAVLMAGVYLILDGSFTIGMLLAFQGLLTSFFEPINELGSLAQTFSSLCVDMEQVEDVMNYRPDTSPDTVDTTIGKLSGMLELKNVTFGYSKLAEPLIRDFSVMLKPGASVAFVGGSGCGKSTLAKLISGLYQPWEGEILFDGEPRGAIDDYSFHSSVAMIDQEITLFQDKISANIRMWDSSIEDFAVIIAAKDADIHSTIVRRPGGYDNIVQENGKNFSGGERQRLEIARVLAMEPTIIIMDEGTSALDAKTESIIMQNIRNTGASCIVIAHRLSTIRDCDEIIVLDKGAVVERGTHDELMAANGAYARLVAVE